MVKGNSWEKKGIYYICIQTIIRVVEICNTSGLISAATLTKFRSRFVKFPWQFCSSKCCIIYNSRKYNTCVLKHFIIIWFYIQVINHAMKTGWANRETSSKLNICYAVFQKKGFFPFWQHLVASYFPQSRINLFFSLQSLFCSDIFIHMCVYCFIYLYIY